jgi:hypothetical protein
MGSNDGAHGPCARNCTYSRTRTRTAIRNYRHRPRRASRTGRRLPPLDRPGHERRLQSRHRAVAAQRR